MDDVPTTKANLLRFMQQGWEELHAFLANYSREQLSTLKDAVGWTPKDHIVHLALWEAGITALLGKHSQREGMGLDEATWQRGEEAINAALRARYQALTLEEVLDLFRHNHEQLVARIESLSDEDLQRPYAFYEPASNETRPVFGWIVGNTFAHFNEHTPWIAAIVDEA